MSKASKRYTIKVSSTTDPTFSPWDIVVADTRYPGVLTVQDPHPFAGDNLLGFEVYPQTCELTVHDDEWQARCQGMTPVFAGKSGMYSVPTLKVDRVAE